MPDAKLEAQFDRFESNLKQLAKLTEEERRKALEAGAAAFATTAAKYTPPAIGKAKIPDIFYENGILFGGVGMQKPFGRRVIIDLLETARGHIPLSPWAGRWLRKGYYFYVTSARSHQSGGRKFKMYCKTLEEARRYAYETHRGSLRAAWGMAFGSIGIREPAAFRRMTGKRPQMADYARASRDEESITLENSHQDAHGSWTLNMESKAYYNALKTMNRKMEKFLEKDKAV